MNPSSQDRPEIAPPFSPGPCGLYLITPDEADTARLLARVEPVLGEGVTWLQYRNKAADAALRLLHGHLERYHEVQIGRPAQWRVRIAKQDEVCGQHPNDRRRHTVERNRLPDHVVAAAKALLPEAIAEQDHGRDVAYLIFRVRESSAPRRRDAEQRDRERVSQGRRFSNQCWAWGSSLKGGTSRHPVER